MLNLTIQQIEQIRNYFIATSVEEKYALQNSISPYFLKGFLNDLKKLFINAPDNETKFISIAKSMGAGQHIELLKEIQQQYYTHLAEMHLNGNNIEDIEQLLKAKNQSFLYEVSYIKELQLAFILNEREELKKKFMELDKADEIKPAEIEQAFKHIERSKLKQQFKDLDELDATGTSMVAEPLLEYGNKPIASKAVAPVYNFNWKSLAIAAGIIGLIITTAVFLNNHKKAGNDLAKENAGKVKKVKIIDNNQLKNRQNKIEEVLANNTLKYNSLQLTVFKEASFGFSAKEEKITVQIHVVNERVAVLEQLLTDGLLDSTVNSPILNAIRNQIDSLKLLNSKYLFSGNILSIYGDNISKPTVYKLSDQYYVRMGRSIYAVKKTIAPQSFKMVSDKIILDKIDKIEFQQQ